MGKNVEKVQEIEKLKGDLKETVERLRKKKAEIVDKMVLEGQLQVMEEKRRADCSFYENGLELLQDELRKYERQLRYINHLH